MARPEHLLSTASKWERFIDERKRLLGIRSDRELAKRAGIANSTLADIKKGRSRIMLDTAARLAPALEVSLDELAQIDLI
jgi:transcriptional regulator with XRE-family HTH domain